MSRVLKRLLEHCLRISDFCTNGQFTSASTEVWRLVAIIVQKLFKQINITFSALQVDAAVVSKHYIFLKVLAAMLQELRSAHRDEEKPCHHRRVFTNGEIVTIGQFSVRSSGLSSSVHSTGVAAKEIEDQLTLGQPNDVILALAVVYMKSLNGIVRLLQGRQGAHAESHPIPPLELCSTSACDFIARVRTHKKRIEHHF
jgi:hypothetical protein